MNQVISENRRARFEYQIEERFEAGIVLTGPEIKAIKAKRADLSSAYARVNGLEVWLINLVINDGRVEHPSRTRKLLLHQGEIGRLLGLSERGGYTIVPIRLYLIRGKAKVELGVGWGRKLHDKRELIKKRDIERDLRRGVV